jgi:hypothetical protein
LACLLHLTEIADLADTRQKEKRLAMQQEKGDSSVLPRDRQPWQSELSNKIWCRFELPRNYKARGVFIHLYGTCG